MDGLKQQLGLGLGLGRTEPSGTDALVERLSRWAESIYSNPLNIALVVAVLWVVIPLVRPSDPDSPRWTPTPSAARSHATAPGDRYTYLPPAHPPTTEWTKYTPRTLAVYDGTGSPSSPSDDSRILLAINRKVFDVTKGRNFYGPGGPYGNFAGRDASRGMAKQSFDLDMLTPLDKPIDKLEDLTPSEIKNMNEWEGHFTNKYGIVGELVDEDRL
ncbi:cytochrome b5 [Testicularia cyperi]|uniref:Cytochrome b5 n=1 Tax=Testicularia cyperi TaxID=1882483 RepID=A0A317XKM5_9BASI|nr:cytochrome b5 [Testicularia cyperi]